MIGDDSIYLKNIKTEHFLMKKVTIILTIVENDALELD